MPNTRRVIIAGSSNHPLAERVAAALGAPLGSCDIARFPDGEIQVELHESVRGCDVYLLQCCFAARVLVRTGVAWVAV